MHSPTNDSARIGQSVANIAFSAYNPATGVFETHSLAEYAGTWLILFFYPADFSFACPKELAEAARHHARLKELGVELVSVSTDSPLAHLHWRTTEPVIKDVNYLMGSDQTGALSRYFGVYDETRGVSRRGTCIINAEGVLACMEMNIYNAGRSGDELLRKLEASMYFAGHQEEGAPLPVSGRNGNAEQTEDSLDRSYFKQSRGKG